MQNFPTQATIFLNQLDQDKALQKIEGRFVPFHIFHHLENAFLSEVSVEERVMMNYRMKINEECLSLLRVRQFNSADLVYQKALDFSFDFSPKVENGMESFFNAMVSYHAYANKDYETALEKMDKALEHTLAQCEILPIFATSIGEQWLNKLRVYIKQGKEEKVINETVEAFKFCLTGYYNDSNKNYFASIGRMKQIGTFFHVANNVCGSIERKYPEQRQEKIDWFTIKILNKLFADEQISNLQTTEVTGLKAVRAALLRNDSELMTILGSDFEAILSIPKCFQKIVVRTFLDICHQENFAFTEHDNFPHFHHIVEKYLGEKLMSIAA